MSQQLAQIFNQEVGENWYLYPGLFFLGGGGGKGFN